MERCALDIPVAGASRLADPPEVDRQHSEARLLQFQRLLFPAFLIMSAPMSQNDGPLAGPVKVGVDQPAVRGRIRDMLVGADSAGKEQEREQCTRSIHALRIKRAAGDRQVITQIAEDPRVDPVACASHCAKCFRVGRRQSRPIRNGVRSTRS